MIDGTEIPCDDWDISSPIECIGADGRELYVQCNTKLSLDDHVLVFFELEKTRNKGFVFTVVGDYVFTVGDWEGNYILRSAEPRTIEELGVNLNSECQLLKLGRVIND